MRIWHTFVVALAFPSIAIVAPSAAQIFDSHDLLILDSQQARVVRVAGGIGADAVSGGFIGTPRKMALDENGDLLIVDQAQDGRVIRVDGETGKQTLVSVGQELDAFVNGIAIDSTGQILVTRRTGLNQRDALIRVDPAGGSQSLLVDTPSNAPFDFRDVAVRSDGEIFVAAKKSGSDRAGFIFHVATGGLLGTVIELDFVPLDLTFDRFHRAGHLLVAGTRRATAVFVRIDSAEWQVLEEFSGQPLDTPRGVDIAPFGGPAPYVLSNRSGSPDQVFVVHPASGVADEVFSMQGIGPSEVRDVIVVRPFMAPTDPPCMDVYPACQVVFLDFNATPLGAEQGFRHYLQHNADFWKPGWGSEDDRDQIVGWLDSFFTDYQLEFTRVRPSTLPYSTVFVGGTYDIFDDPPDSDLTLLKLPPSAVGLAEAPDIGNRDRTDKAVVFADSARLLTNESVAEVAAHEVGHLLGLFHIDAFWRLMTAEHFFQGETIAATDESIIAAARVLPYVQNSTACLARNVGPAWIIDPAQRCFPRGLSHRLWRLGSSLSIASYDSKLALYTGTDTVPTLMELGDIPPGATDFPVEVGDFPISAGFFLGSSVPGGPADLFSSVSDPGGLGIEELPAADLAEPIVTDNGDSLDPAMSVYRDNGAGMPPTPVGTVQLVPEPTEGALLVAGIFGMVILRGWHRRRAHLAKDSNRLGLRQRPSS